MFQVAGPAPGFLQFVQILGWIVLPIFISAVLFSIFLHYRRKKRATAVIESGEVEFMVADAEQVGYTRGDGEYVLFDHSGLIREYKKRLTYNHARYTALQHDYASLEDKYTALARYAGASLITSKNDEMENLNQTMPAAMQDEVKELSNRHAVEKKELLARLEMFTRNCKHLEEENENLIRQAVTNNGTDYEKTEWMNRWKEENTQLKNRIGEQECLKDILEEKNAQINFLQSQLEQRIKHQHTSDQLKLQAETDLQDQTAQMQHSIDEYKNELMQRQEEADKLQVKLLEKEELLAEKERLLATKLDQIALLENELKEFKSQNELLHASTADGQDHLRNVEQALSDEKSRVQYLEQKLNTNKQNMRRLYKEMANCIGEEIDSPVIALRAEVV